MEKWESIPGYEGYKISSRGRVFSEKKKRQYKNEGILNGFVNNQGYKVVPLSNGRERKRFLVHRLVAMAFIPKDSPQRNDVDHKDGNRLNNSVDNLRWVTQLENLKFARERSDKFKNVGRPVTVYYDNGKVENFECVAHAASRLGLDKGILNRRLWNGCVRIGNADVFFSNTNHKKKSKAEWAQLFFLSGKWTSAIKELPKKQRYTFDYSQIDMPIETIRRGLYDAFRSVGRFPLFSIDREKKRINVSVYDDKKEFLSARHPKKAKAELLKNRSATELYRDGEYTKFLRKLPEGTTEVEFDSAKSLDKLYRSASYLNTSSVFRYGIKTWHTRPKVVTIIVAKKNNGN